MASMRHAAVLAPAGTSTGAAGVSATVDAHPPPQHAAGAGSGAWAW
ncbi:hypothetical protein [Cupriavidus taiwanensis]